MILAIDAGNSNIVFGTVSEGQVGTVFRIHTDQNSTAEEYGITAQMLASVQSEKSVQKDLTGEETESQHAEDTKTQDVESLRPETESSQDDMLAMAAMRRKTLQTIHSVSGRPRT